MLDINPLPADSHRLSARDVAARWAGTLLIGTALITVVMALARVAADADGPTAAETLEGIALSPGWSGLAGAARLVSGLTLLGAAWCLGRTWIIKQRWGSPAVPWLLGWSGGFTVVSGLAGVGLAMSAPARFPLLAEPQVTELLESVLTGRALAGKTGFALAGLALMVASRYQWKVGGALRRFSPGSAMLGTAMQFIWVDSATMVHPVVGAGFFLWLLGVGGMLFTGRTERLFAELVGRSDLKADGGGVA